MAFEPQEPPLGLAVVWMSWCCCLVPARTMLCGSSTSKPCAHLGQCWASPTWWSFYPQLDHKKTFIKCREPAWERRALLASALSHNIFVSCIMMCLNCTDEDTTAVLISQRLLGHLHHRMAAPKWHIAANAVWCYSCWKTVLCFLTKEADQTCFTFNKYLAGSPTQFFLFLLPYFAAPCICVSRNTEMALSSKYDGSYSKPLWKGILNDLGVCVVWPKAACETAACSAEISYFFLILV